jgi:hypothetical protein
MRAALFFTLISLACSTESIESDPEVEVEVEALVTLEPELRVEVEAARVPEGSSVVVEHKQWLPEGWTLELGEIEAPGLEVQLLTTSPPIDDGGRKLRVTRHSINGPSGSYIILPGESLFTSPEGETHVQTPAAIFIDIGVEAPGETELTEFEAVPEAPAPAIEKKTPWVWIASGLVLLALLGVILWKRRVSAEPALSPMEQALKDWKQIRCSDLDDQALAYQLSWIFRTYLETVDSWPASRRTSSEVLHWLNYTRQPPLSDDLNIAAERILQATDRLKFAREGGGVDFFDSLEHDLIELLQATSTPEAPVLEEDTHE